MSETLIVNYLIKGRVKMNVEELVQKAKDLIGEGNVEHAQQFIEEHKDELGEHYHKITAMLADRNSNSVPDGTVVNFVAEGGKVDGSCKTVDGQCSVTLRTQNPRPSNGRVTVLAYVEGDKSYLDKDGDGVYDCSFKEGVNKLEFNGSDSVIKGYDSEGKEIFSHTYHYVGIEEVRGLYEFKSDDADSGEFTYFCIAPDTNDTTYHIELRYGSDLEALGKYDEGDYAYWLGSGISTDYDQTMVENCIELFCKENLSE